MSDALDFEMEDDFEEAPQVVSLTLPQFVTRAKQFLDAKDMDNFTRFVLTGVHDRTQYLVDAIKDAVSANHPIEYLRDYDSILGLHEKICVNDNLTMWPVSKFEDTLSRNVHIKYSFTNETGQYTDIPIHRIPNICIAKWSTHNMIRVLLPGLYTKERKSPFLNQTESACFYNDGLRPAIEALVNAGIGEWPPTYTAEMFRARGKDGKLSFQTKTVPEYLVEYIGNELREKLSANGVSWGQGLLFLHQIRGVKASNGHTPTSMAAREAFDDILTANSISDDAHGGGRWWVDVGLELASKWKDCLAWRTDSHFHVVKDVLDISDLHARRITQPGSSKYMRDMTSHLTTVSGCRISPGLRAQGPYNVLYLQMYMTDKSITYRPDGVHFGKFLRGQDILRGKADDYCHDLYELYREASEKNFSLARIEVRVPLNEAANVLLELDIEAFRGGLVSFDRSIWWTLRAHRVLAFKTILEQQKLGRSSVRSSNSALLLTAAAPWFLNGLHSAPDNGPSSRDLMGKILPLVNRVDADIDSLAYPARTRVRQPQLPVEEEDEDEDEEVVNPQEDADEDNMSVHSDFSDVEDAPVPIHRHARRGNRPETLPHNPYGIVFLREIRIGDGIVVPRFLDRHVPMITDKTFRYIFGIDRENVDIEYFRAQLVVPSNPRRIANRTHRTATRFVEAVEAPRIFNLAERGYELPPTIRDEGSDVEDDDEPEVVNEALDLDAKLTELWRQFLVDVTAKAPNFRDARQTSYCILTKAQRDRVNDATYQNLRLREYFLHCQYRTASKSDWDKAFEKFWPEKDGTQLVGKSQNLPSMTYYLAWSKWLSDIPYDHLHVIAAMRKGLQKRFNALKWIPNIQSDRVWYTRATTDARFQRFPDSDVLIGPLILIRWDERAII